MPKRIFLVTSQGQRNAGEFYDADEQQTWQTDQEIFL